MKKEEKEIYKILVELIKPDDMEKIKNIRKESLLMKAETEGLTKKEQDELDNLENIDINELVAMNYSSNYLIDIKEDKKVLVMGINPGGGTKIKEDLNTNQKFLCIDVDEEKYKNKDWFEELKNKEIIYQNYYYRNYNLFKNIGGRLFWSAYDLKEIEKNLKRSLSEETMKKLEELYNSYNDEEKAKGKKGPYVVYGDLFYYADGTQDNIKNNINKCIKENEKETNDKIKQILDIHIDFYKPKMIVITNAFASDLLKNALKEEAKIIGENGKIENNSDDHDAVEYREIPVIFSGMVSGGHSLDKYSYIRLQRRIEKIYKAYWEEK